MFNLFESMFFHERSAQVEYFDTPSLSAMLWLAMRLMCTSRDLRENSLISVECGFRCPE
jgi:hypothetical protein